MNNDNTDLKKAQCHVAKIKPLVACQQALLAILIALGRDTEAAQQTLATFEWPLHVTREHLSEEMRLVHPLC